MEELLFGLYSPGAIVPLRITGSTEKVFYGYGLFATTQRLFGLRSNPYLKSQSSNVIRDYRFYANTGLYYSAGKLKLESIEKFKNISASGNYLYEADIDIETLEKSKEFEIFNSNIQRIEISKPSGVMAILGKLVSMFTIMKTFTFKTGGKMEYISITDSSNREFRFRIVPVLPMLSDIVNEFLSTVYPKNINYGNLSKDKT